MISDSLKNIEEYSFLPKKLFKGLIALQKAAAEEFIAGRTEIDEDIYINRAVYETKESSDFEAHRKYVDIQYLYEGHELIKCADISRGKVKNEYNAEKDCEMLEYDGKEVELFAKQGSFAVFFPQDMHAPGLSDKEKTQVKKIIVKVRL